MSHPEVVDDETFNGLESLIADLTAPHDDDTGIDCGGDSTFCRTCADVLALVGAVEIANRGRVHVIALPPWAEKVRHVRVVDLSDLLPSAKRYHYCESCGMHIGFTQQRAIAKDIEA